MKQFKPLLIGLILLLFSQVSSAQNQQNASCIPSQAFLVINREYALEYITPVKWELDKEYSQTIKAPVYSPSEHTKEAERIQIIIKGFPNLMEENDFNTTINNQIIKYNGYKKKEVKKLLLHSSIDDAKRFVFTKKGENTVETVTYIKKGNNLITIALKSPNKQSYNEYIEQYSELLSSIKIQKL